MLPQNTNYPQKIQDAFRHVNIDFKCVRFKPDTLAKTYYIQNGSNGEILCKCMSDDYKEGYSLRTIPNTSESIDLPVAGHGMLRLVNPEHFSIFNIVFKVCTHKLSNQSWVAHNLNPELHVGNRLEWNLALSNLEQLPCSNFNDGVFTTMYIDRLEIPILLWHEVEHAMRVDLGFMRESAGDNGFSLTIMFKGIMMASIA